MSLRLGALYDVAARAPRAPHMVLILRDVCAVCDDGMNVCYMCTSHHALCAALRLPRVCVEMIVESLIVFLSPGHARVACASTETIYQRSEKPEHAADQHTYIPYICIPEPSIHPCMQDVCCGREKERTKPDSLYDIQACVRALRSPCNPSPWPVLYIAYIERSMMSDSVSSLMIYVIKRH